MPHSFRPIECPLRTTATMICCAIWMATKSFDYDLFSFGVSVDWSCVKQCKIRIRREKWLRGFFPSFYALKYDYLMFLIFKNIALTAHGIVNTSIHPYKNFKTNWFVIPKHHSTVGALRWLLCIRQYAFEYLWLWTIQNNKNNRSRSRAIICLLVRLDCSSYKSHVALESEGSHEKKKKMTIFV